ncbi:hypothetical protein GCM10023189_02240 [Nibrella saemangeumensis]|uniref:4-alpha-glucanotransferase n=1 Tax=Nibrella saemangeumensis TaxID=1084526 RepID=A0ABP8M990_9BACT
MYNPVATYRLQFHGEFTFDDLDRIIPYLQKLGVGTVYASPIFEAPADSTHGYDGVNPHRANPGIGTKKQLQEVSQSLKDRGIGWLQDIVPNHMAFHPDNPWLIDVLEKGQISEYAAFFDVAWTGKLYRGRIMVPFLGASLEEVLDRGELAIVYEDNRFWFRYYDTDYPLHLRSYATILKSGTEQPADALQQLIDQIKDLHDIAEPKAYATRWEELRQQLGSLMKNEVVKSSVDACLKAVNEDKERLKQISDEQIYRLCYYGETDKQINYRRFFTVNSLICLNIQDKDVFDHYHVLIKSMVEQGIFQGLRIDHIDGLFDPTGYLENLREMTGDETYIIVEKILEPGEDIPKNWPIQGNTGYDFLSIVNNLFTQKQNEAVFTRFYQNLVGDTTPIQEQIFQKKAHILQEHMGGEHENLYQLFLVLNLAEEQTLSEIRPEVLKEAIGELLIQCPVYRYYGNRFPLGSEEAAAVQEMLNGVRERKPELGAAVALLENVLLRKPAEGDEEYNRNALRFYQRCMQFTGPLMAKGVEDTLMYTYNRFIGHNEVGDSLEAFGVSPGEFHRKMQERQQNWPLSINATATHDTKRGEDVRARLNVLTDLADEWIEAVQEWQRLNAGLKKDGAPDINDEYFIYQTLIGSYRMPNQDEDDYKNRLQAYLEKALREAKQHSNWTTPNETYEQATKDFAAGLLDHKGPFWKSFQKLHQKVVDFGVVNSLAQVVLKFTCPGVPDVYQGTELWDLSLVDPDNRRAVSYGQREQWLEELEARSKEKPGALLKELWKNRFDARIKLWLVHTLLNERKEQAEVFTNGQYIPLAVEGKFKDNVLAFARQHQQTWYIVAVPLHLAELVRKSKDDVQDFDWKDTRIVLPQQAPDEWEHLLLKTKDKHDNDIAVKDIFKRLPLAVLKMQQPVTNRAAGILLSITSLPSPFGIGDMGPEARTFADFLYRSRQKYWQLLPLNVTEQAQGHSPYSAISSIAGNTLLISPDLLVEEGLLEARDVKKYHQAQSDKVDFAAAERVKEKIFDKAYANFVKSAPPALQQAFDQFCEQEASWLDDFAIYLALKQQHKGKPWFQWPDKYKKRQSEALRAFTDDHAEDLHRIKWLQFVFAKHWREFKAYCNNHGVQLFGDLPFYISYDSVDVWSNPDIFNVDEDGKMTGVAGVPPDYFSEDGQLWGMPTFKWDVLKERGYDWWIQRIRKNMQLFDLLRLDHFRAFADFWDVPAGEKTARNGEWKRGPRSELFQILEAELGHLSLVAEDLGDIDEPVYQLRDEFNLPGMRVVQFAFNDSLPVTEHIPHNYNTTNCVAYTGTHDNNTTVGWYRKDAGKADRKRLEQYVGGSVREKDVHQVLARLIYGSVARIAMLPIQDVLGLDETARLNTPGSGENNWQWRLKPGQLTPEAEKWLKKMTKMFNRG